MGAISAGADDRTLPAFPNSERPWTDVQAVDDLLDVTQSTEHVGKATGRTPRWKTNLPGPAGSG